MSLINKQLRALIFSHNSNGRETSTNKQARLQKHQKGVSLARLEPEKLNVSQTISSCWCVGEQVQKQEIEEVNYASPV